MTDKPRPARGTAEQAVPAHPQRMKTGHFSRQGLCGGAWPGLSCSCSCSCSSVAPFLPAPSVSYSNPTPPPPAPAPALDRGDRRRRSMFGRPRRRRELPSQDCPSMNRARARARARFRTGPLRVSVFEAGTGEYPALAVAGRFVPEPVPVLSQPLTVHGAGYAGARPSSTATTSRTTQLMFRIAVGVREARCGSRRTLGRSSSGCDGGIGSGSWTSSTARPP